MLVFDFSRQTLCLEDCTTLLCVAVVYSFSQLNSFPVQIYHNTCIHSSVVRHLGSFHFGDITNTAIMNLQFHVFDVQMYVFLRGIYLGGEGLGHRIQPHLDYSHPYRLFSSSGSSHTCHFLLLLHFLLPFTEIGHEMQPFPDLLVCTLHALLGFCYAACSPTTVIPLPATSLCLL